MPTTSSAASGSSPSSSPASSAPASSASSARRAAASRRSSAPVFSRPSPAECCRAARAGGVCCCVPASGRWRSFAACSCRERRILSPRPSTRCPPTHASSSPSTSSRSCSPPAAPTPSAPPSPTRSPARPLIRTVAQSSWSRCALTSTGASPPTRGSPSCWAGTTCWSGRCRPRSCGAPSSCPPPGWGCGWSPSWPTRWSTTWRASRARCRCCPPPCSSSGRSGEDNALTLAAYRESGGVHGAVARLAEGTYARIPDERRPIVRAVMLRLVGEGEGEAPVRRRAPLAELDLERNEDVADVLATLADSRLVTVGEGTVEVAHEALLREWPRLREWIEEDTEGRRLRRHITQAATEWDAAGRDQGELYRGARLAAALDWTADHALDAQRARARVRHREPRGLRAGDETRPAHEPPPARPARRGRGPAGGGRRRRDLRRRPARRGARRGDRAARPAPRRSGARRGGPRPLAPARSPGGRDRRLAADPRLSARGSPALAGGGRDHAGGSDTEFLRGIDVSPDGRTLAVGSFRDGLLFFDTRTFEQIGGSRSVTGHGRAASRTARTETRSRSAETASSAARRAHAEAAGREALVEATVTQVDVHQRRLADSSWWSPARRFPDSDHDPRRRHAGSRSAPPIEPEGFTGSFDLPALDGPRSSR